MVNNEHTRKSQLVLGWRVNDAGEPEYWRNHPDAKAGAAEQEEYLVNVPAGSMGTHTIIIAQSGSGKSFFLGRLIEELMVRTRCNCIILDPNADFLQVSNIEDESLWVNAHYDSTLRRGKLPHEKCKEEFQEHWDKVSIEVTGQGNDPSDENYKQLKLEWRKVSAEFLGGDLKPLERSDLSAYHDLVKAFDTLWRSMPRESSRSTRKLIDLLTEVQDLLADKLSKDELRARLAADFLAVEETNKAGTAFLDVFFQKLVHLRKKEAIEQALIATELHSSDVERFYFRKARQYLASGIMDTTVKPRRPSTFDKQRLKVVDLPSLPNKDTRLLVINTLLTTVWDEARSAWNQALKQIEKNDMRVPTFVVIDEAHNLISAQPRSRAEIALTDQFRTIIAEGRKYGLFLILVSQRPDKLDRLIVSECENKAIMRLGSESVLDRTKRLLGLEGVPNEKLLESLQYQVGSVLLMGRWSPEPQRIYGAARRTKEGGRNLRESYWATAPQSGVL